MHRAINIKYRIVRRVDVDKAPLATFDTVDLGDEDVELTCHRPGSNTSAVVADDSSHPLQLFYSNKPAVFVSNGGLKSETIGGNSSKKSLSQAGGEDKESKTERVKDKADSSEVENVQETKGAVAEHATPETKRSEVKLTETATHRSEAAAGDREKNVESNVSKTTDVPTLVRQGTIGRVTIPIKKQDSDSSSSSPGSCSEAQFTFQAFRPSVGNLDRAVAEEQLPDSDALKEGFDSLVPEYLDPSQILSPSKRKAYERRIERLKVTTSPIARPRSNAPISVVTLDEYAAIGSPESSPAAISGAQDKLKITLPTDEFPYKPKTPKLQSAKKDTSGDTCFEFTEEFLFSRTKSALVVIEDGQLPLSPRRLLIPPNLTPTTSPKLSPSPKFPTDSFHKEADEAPQLKDTDTFFGAAADESEGENWANFPDENGGHDTSSSTVCDTGENVLPESPQASLDLNWGPAAFCGDFQSTETLPPEPTVYHLDSPKESEATKTVCDVYINEIHFPETFPDNIGDLAESGGYSVNNITSFEEPHVKLNPDYESDEIITIEINPSAKGGEKHIGIEIRSRGDSGSVSPVSSDWLVKSHSSEFSEALQGSAPDQPYSSPSINNNASVINKNCDAASGFDFSFLEGDLVAGSCLEITSRSFQEVQVHNSLPFSSDVLTPEIEFGSMNYRHDSQRLHSPQQTIQQQQPQRTDDKPDLQQRPPSTNPFDIDYEPPASDPFDIGLHFQAIQTNPFLEQPSSTLSELFNFPSSSLDSSSA